MKLDKIRDMLIDHAKKSSGNISTKVAACVIFDDGEMLFGANRLRDGHKLSRQQIIDRTPEYYEADICAEQDLLIKARDLDRSVEGLTIYSTLFPCPKCARQIADAHVGCVISLAHRGTKLDTVAESMKIFDSAGIKYDPGVVDNKLGKICQ